MHRLTKGGMDRCRTTRCGTTPTHQRRLNHRLAGQANNGNQRGVGPIPTAEGGQPGEVPPTLVDPADRKTYQQAPTPTQLEATSTSRKRNYCEEEQFSPPTTYEQPYGTKEGVAISTSWIDGAGRGLFGIKPSPHNPLLNKQANEFVCVYATMEDVITMEEARISESAYIWTNSKNLQLDWDPMALYFDAINNRHYRKFANDTWTESGNNCKIIWNPLLRRAEV